MGYQTSCQLLFDTSVNPLLTKIPEELVQSLGLKGSRTDLLFTQGQGQDQFPITCSLAVVCPLQASLREVSKQKAQQRKEGEEMVSQSQTTPTLVFSTCSLLTMREGACRCASAMSWVPEVRRQPVGIDFKPTQVPGIKPNQSGLVAFAH